jgi:hypothetical protein
VTREDGLAAVLEAFAHPDVSFESGISRGLDKRDTSPAEAEAAAEELANA